MPYYCTVPRCTSMAGKAKNVSFHQFPRDEELAKLWNRILKRGKPYTKYSKVCSLHFKPEDYTITSVGKNKGQWRTLRKDAIPSQNLPSESPAPYTRRSSGCWVPSQPNLTDPLVQQQMAQAIYMQTMLAMQTAGASDSLASGEPPPQTPESNKPSPSSSSLSEIELLLRRDPDTPKEVTYKCHECTKCFKDPDVFLLHKRTHKNDTTLNVEKENYSANIQDRDETLRANPILANLLKTSMRLEPETNMANILTVENQIMAALASNMEAYIRTLSSMLASQNSAIETGHNEDRGQSDYEGETKDDDDDSKDEAKVKCEANDMFVDTNEHDTPMDDDEDDEHRKNEDEVIQDENKEEISNSFGITEGENRIEMLANQNIMYPSEVGSRDDNCTIKDETSEARDDIFDENLSNAREIHEASNDAHNNKSSSNRTELNKARTDVIVHEYYDVHDNQIRNKTENEDTGIDENRMYTDENNIADDTARKAYETKNDALVDVREANDDDSSKDEMVDDDTSKDEMLDDDTSKDEMVDDDTSKDEMLDDDTSKDEMVDDDTSKDEIVDDDTSKDEMVDDDTSKDEMVDDDTNKDEMFDDDTSKDETVDDGSKLVQGDPACDNVVELIKVDIEFET